MTLLLRLVLRNKVGNLFIKRIVIKEVGLNIKNIILFFGRITKAKGLRILIKALAKVKREFNKELKLFISSGRFKESILSVIEKEKLIQPDAVISNMGTEIYYAPNWGIDKEWENIIGENWNKGEIASILSRFYLQPQPYEKKFVILYYIEEESIAKKVRETLKGHKVKVVCTRGFQLQKVIKAPVTSTAPVAFSVFSDKLYLDIVPECAGEGKTAVDSPPLIYFYSDIKCVAVNEEWFSLLPVKER